MSFHKHTKSSKSSADANVLIEVIMDKGIKQHFAPEVLALAEKLYGTWAASFEGVRTWKELRPLGRIAWCRVALEVQAAKSAPPHTVHVPGATPGGEFECRACGTTFSSSDALESHRNNYAHS